MTDGIDYASPLGVVVTREMRVAAGVLIAWSVVDFAGGGFLAAVSGLMIGLSGMGGVRDPVIDLVMVPLFFVSVGLLCWAIVVLVMAIMLLCGRQRAEAWAFTACRISEVATYVCVIGFCVGFGCGTCYQGSRYRDFFYTAIAVAVIALPAVSLTREMMGRLRVVACEMPRSEDRG